MLALIRKNAVHDDFFKQLDHPANAKPNHKRNNFRQLISKCKQKIKTENMLNTFAILERFIDWAG